MGGLSKKRSSGKHIKTGRPYEDAAVVDNAKGAYRSIAEGAALPPEVEEKSALTDGITVNDDYAVTITRYSFPGYNARTKGGGMIKIVLSSFVMVFLMELGDKTQLAVFALTTESSSPWAVLLGAGSALLLSTALVVGLGALLSETIPSGWTKSLHYVAGILFIIGLLPL